MGLKNIAVVFFGALPLLAHGSQNINSDTAVTAESWTSELLATGKSEVSFFEFGYSLGGEASGSISSSEKTSSNAELEVTASVLAKVWGEPKLFGLYNNSFSEKTTQTTGKVSGTWYFGESRGIRISPVLGLGIYDAQIKVGSSTSRGSGRRGQNHSGEVTSAGAASTSLSTSTKSLMQTSVGASLGFVPNEKVSLSIYGTKYFYDTKPETFLSSTQAGSAGRPMNRSSQAILSWLTLFAQESYGLYAQWDVLPEWQVASDAFRVVSAVTTLPADYLLPTLKWQFLSNHAVEIQHERSLNVNSANNWALLFVSGWTNSFTTELGVTNDQVPSSPVWGGSLSFSYSF